MKTTRIFDLLALFLLMLLPAHAASLESSSKVLDSKALQSLSFASASTPYIITAKEAQIFHTDGIITAISAFNDTIFVGNANGSVEVYTRSLNPESSPDSDKSSPKSNAKPIAKPATKPKSGSKPDLRKIHTFSFPPITDYFNESFQPRIFSLSSDGKSLYVLKEGSRGTKEIFRFPLGTLGTLQAKISESKPLFTSHSAPKSIIAFRTAQKELLLVGYLENKIALYDATNTDTNPRELFATRASHASFSDFALLAPYVFSTDESGAVHVLSLDSGALLSKLEGINKDNNYQIAAANGTILTASADRQMGIYHFLPPATTPTSSKDAPASTTFTLSNATSIKSEFLIYAVGISPSAKLAAFSKNEQNDIAIIDLKQKRELATLQSALSSINTLLFLDERTLLVGSDERHFSLWHLPSFD